MIPVSIYEIQIKTVPPLSATAVGPAPRQSFRQMPRSFHQPPPNLLGSFFARGRGTADESPLIFRSRVSMAHAMAAAANKINTKIKPPISLMISPYRHDD
jgi:hypothetical protein